jgi:hypothetical protein
MEKRQRGQEIEHGITLKLEKNFFTKSGLELVIFILVEKSLF